MCILNFLIAMLPGILWMTFVYKSDKFEPEPLTKVIFVFAMGAVSVLAALVIELGIVAIFGASSMSDAQSLWELAFHSWIVAGVVEEVVKFCTMVFFAYFAKDFSEPLDGIVYSSAVALGFASLENFLYMEQYGTNVIFIRAAFSTAGHLLFSAMWGYALGRGKFAHKLAKRLVITGLALSAVLHGLYNFLLMSPSFYDDNLRAFGFAIFLAAFGGMWIIFLRKLHRAQALSASLAAAHSSCPPADEDQ